MRGLCIEGTACCSAGGKNAFHVVLLLLLLQLYGAARLHVDPLAAPAVISTVVFTPALADVETATGTAKREGVAAATVPASAASALAAAEPALAAVPALAPAAGVAPEGETAPTAGATPTAAAAAPAAADLYSSSSNGTKAIPAASTAVFTPTVAASGRGAGEGNLSIELERKEGEPAATATSAGGGAGESAGKKAEHSVTAAAGPPAAEEGSSKRREKPETEAADKNGVKQPARERVTRGKGEAAARGVATKGAQTGRSTLLEEQTSAKPHIERKAAQSSIMRKRAATAAAAVERAAAAAASSRTGSKKGRFSRRRSSEGLRPSRWTYASAWTRKAPATVFRQTVTTHPLQGGRESHAIGARGGTAETSSRLGVAGGLSRAEAATQWRTAAAEERGLEGNEGEATADAQSSKGKSLASASSAAATREGEADGASSDASFPTSAAADPSSSPSPSAANSASLSFATALQRGVMRLLTFERCDRYTQKVAIVASPGDTVVVRCQGAAHTVPPDIQTNCCRGTCGRCTTASAVNYEQLYGVASIPQFRYAMGNGISSAWKLKIPETLRPPFPIFSVAWLGPAVLDIPVEAAGGGTGVPTATLVIRIEASPLQESTLALLHPPPCAIADVESSGKGKKKKKGNEELTDEERRARFGALYVRTPLGLRRVSRAAVGAAPRCALQLDLRPTNIGWAGNSSSSSKRMLPLLELLHCLPWNAVLTAALTGSAVFWQ